MRNKILISLLMLSLVIGGVVGASSLNGDYKGMPVVKVRVNNVEVHPEVAAHIEGDGTTLLPLRVVTEALGATVTWHGDSYSVDVDKRELSLTQLNKIGDSVGEVFVYDQSNNYVGQGSGFLLANGVFVMNYHVGAAGTKLKIEINGKEYNTNGESLFKNEASDLFAVRISETSGLTLASQLPKSSEKVYALGFPHGKFQITDGIFGYVNSDNKIVHKARTESGSSGGVLINVNGEVIGVTSNGISGTEFNEAIPAKYVQQEIDKVK